MTFLNLALLLHRQFAKYLPNAALNSPYNVFLRHLGMNTTSSLHSHLVWLRL